MADIVPPPTNEPQQDRPPKFRGTWADPAIEALEKCRERRRRVLAHPDLAAKLCEPPLRLARPEVWTGYIPGPRVPTLGGEKPNKSPIRRQLLDIVRAVAERETQLQEPEAP